MSITPHWSSTVNMSALQERTALTYHHKTFPLSFPVPVPDHDHHNTHLASTSKNSQKRVKVAYPDPRWQRNHHPLPLSHTCLPVSRKRPYISKFPESRKILGSRICIWRGLPLFCHFVAVAVAVVVTTSQAKAPSKSTTTTSVTSLTPRKQAHADLPHPIVRKTEARGRGAQEERSCMVQHRVVEMQSQGGPVGCGVGETREEEEDKKIWNPHKNHFLLGRMERKVSAYCTYIHIYTTLVRSFPILFLRMYSAGRERLEVPV